MSNNVFSAKGGRGILPTIFIEDALMPGANASGVATPFTSMTSPSPNESAPSMCAVGVRCVSPEKYMPLPLGSATSAKTPDASRHPTTCVTTPVAQTSPAWAASVLDSAATSEKDMAASSIHVAVMSLFYQISCDFWRRGFQPRQPFTGQLPRNPTSGRDRTPLRSRSSSSCGRATCSSSRFPQAYIRRSRLRPLR